VLRLSSLSRKAVVFAVLLVLCVPAVAAPSFPPEQAMKLLPDRLGNSRATNAALGLKAEAASEAIQFFKATSGAYRPYASRSGDHLTLTVITTATDSNAFGLLTSERSLLSRQGGKDPAIGGVGTASYIFTNKLIFTIGQVYGVVDASASKEKSPDPAAMVELAKSFVQTLGRTDADVPVLIKHLPNWQTAQQQALYAANLDTLKATLNNPEILSAVTFEGGAEAVVATYESSRLVIIEFNTPQLAGDNDRRITAKLHELQSQGQPVPTAYRRVGNYSVFVFGGPNEQAANQLIDQVKYEQLVQWLGDNPNWLRRAQMEYTETTLGVFVAVVKASGLVLLTCFAVGGFLGALLFNRRRAQQKSLAAFSDAGGMMRLNLDEMTPQTDPKRLIERGR
jgi:hypothetical protein